MPPRDRKPAPRDRRPAVVSSDARIAVALSGGGYRAAAFAAGALLYLADSGKAEQIAAISSVSGGSITNAYFARNVMGVDSSPETTAWKKASWLLAFLARRDILSPFRMTTFAAILAIPLGFSVGAIVLSANGGVLVAIGAGLVAGLIAMIVSFLVLYLQLLRSLELAIEWLLRLPDIAHSRPSTARLIRGPLRFWFAVLTLRPRRAIQSAGPSMTPLSELLPRYSPIFCCTDLASGSQFYISTSFVAGVAPSLGGDSASINLSGAAPMLPVATAVAASAAFPAVFRPAVIDANDLGLPALRGIIDERIVLADGGLYDNFGVTVLDAWLSADMDSAVLGDLGATPQALIVLDCGLPAYQRQHHRSLVRTVARSMDVIHQANSFSRRREIKRLFETRVRNGSLVTIGDDPFEIAERCESSVARERILSWLEATKPQHRLTRAGWRALAQQRDPGVQTNLRRLGAEQVAQLVLHGYVATMARTVADLGWIPGPPERLPADIAKLCTSPFVGSFRHRIAWVLSGSFGEVQSSRNR